MVLLIKKVYINIRVLNFNSLNYIQLHHLFTNYEFDFGFSSTSAVFSKRVGEENQQCSDSETLSSRANGHWSRWHSMGESSASGAQQPLGYSVRPVSHKTNSPAAGPQTGLKGSCIPQESFKLYLNIKMQFCLNTSPCLLSAPGRGVSHSCAGAPRVSVWGWADTSFPWCSPWRGWDITGPVAHTSRLHGHCRGQENRRQQSCWYGRGHPGCLSPWFYHHHQTLDYHHQSTLWGGEEGMTLRIEPLESCMNVLNVFSLKCFILSIYILCCLFSILSRGLTIIKIFCVYYRPVLTNGLMSDRSNFNVKIKVAVILWLLVYTVCYFILSSFIHFSDPKYPVSLIIFITNQLRLKKIHLVTIAPFPSTF